MSRKLSFQTDLSMSARISYSEKGNNDPYAFKRYTNNFDKFSSQVQDRNSFDQTHYTSGQQDFSGIRKLPDSVSSIRETFSYVPSTSSKRFQYQPPKNISHQINSKLGDVLRQTMDLRTIKRKDQFNLQRSVSGNLNFNQNSYIKSQNQIREPLSFSKHQDRSHKYDVKDQTIKSYGYISKHIEQKSYTSSVQQQIRKIRQQRQQHNVKKQIDLQQSVSFIKNNSNVKNEKQKQKEKQKERLVEKQKFSKKNYIQYYTPKVQKTNYNERFNETNVLSPQGENNKKDTSFDSQSQSPKKITDMKTLKLTLEKKTSKNIKLTQSANQKVNIHDFFVGKTLGQGRFGTAHIAFHKSSGAIFAIKKVKKDVIRSNKLIDQFILEVKLQSFLIHPFILKIYGIFDDQIYVYLVLQFMEQGSLFNYLKKFKKLSQTDTAEKVRYLAQAIKYLQDRGIAHRDIKPENIIMTNDVCKLADFGWATFCDQQRRKTYCGTCDYVAPQILQGQQYDQTVDLWCIGVMAYELMTGRAPFYHMSMRQTKKKIINVSLTYPEDFSENSKSFVSNLIQKDPEQRMSIQQTLAHPFIKNVKLTQ